MPLEQVGLEAVFDTSAFQRGQRIYERGLDSVNTKTTRTARSLTAAWGDSTAGLEDMFSRLDAMRGQTDDMAASLAGMGDEAAVVATGLSAVGAAAVGVGVGLAIVGAVGAAIWRKIDDAAMDYLARSKEVIKTQERVNEAWDEASRHLAQTLIPLKVELLELELKLAEAVADVADTFKKLVAIAHSGIAAVVAGLGAIPEAIAMAFRGEVPTFEDLWDRMTEAGEEAFSETMLAYRDAFRETFEETEEEAEDNWDKIADAVQSALDRVEDMQIAHNRRLTDLADDYRVKQERAWAKYERSVAKEIERGQARIAKLEARYQERRSKAIADYNKRALKAEQDLARNIAKAQADFALREQQTRERYNLDRIQGERRYQFERARLVAEGDTLAIEELDARHKLEQEEQAESEALRQKQAQETQDAMVEAMRVAGREQADALAEALAEQLAELQEQSRRQIAEQGQTNRDRLDEMAEGFAEQQRLADEDYQLSLDKADRNYQRQQEDLGRNLARQEELQELGAEEVATLLDRYYGEDGVADRIMEGWHERENARIMVTAALLTQLGQWKPLEPGGIPMPGQVPGMQYGGVLEGPAMAYVEPGVREAFVPLTGPGAGGAFTHEFLNALNITGLEGASQVDVSRVARELAVSLTQKIRTRRRT